MEFDVLFVIALAIIVIYLYYLFIKWLFVSVGPGFIYVISLLFSVAVPVVYVHALWMTFRSKRKTLPMAWNGLFVLVVAIIELIHIDLIWIALAFGMKILHVPFVSDLHRFLSAIVMRFPVNHAILAFIHSLLPNSREYYVLLSAAIKMATIVPLVILARGLSSKLTLETSDEPAFLSYFHGQAFKDLGSVIQVMVKDLAFLIIMVNKGIVRVTIFGSVFVWPLTLMTYVALIPPIIIAAVTTLLFLVMHAISLGLVWVFAMALSGLFTVMEKAVILSRAGYAKCPHAECHEPVPLPIFICPNCGAQHNNLLPGKFGIFKRTCKCGARLPTLFWLGKGRLDSVCPHCHKPMSAELFGGSVHIPIYGGPSTGKTMYLMSTTWSLLKKQVHKDKQDDKKEDNNEDTTGSHLENKVPKIQVHFIDKATKNNYENHWKKDFESGRVREKTVEPYPDAFLLGMRRVPGLPTSVYLYDPAGEALADESLLDAHRFMKYIDGLVLLIDPLSLQSFAERYSNMGGPDVSITTSHLLPEETITRVINLLERLGNLSTRHAGKQRIAVVLNKADLPGLQQELGIKLEDRDLHDDWNNLGADEESNKIHDWLKKNDPHLMQILETRFQDIRFFAVSALGHIPKTGQGFSPIRVLEPLAWLLSKRNTFAHPLWGRIAGRAMEALAVVAVLGFFVALPIGFAYWFWLQL